MKITRITIEEKYNLKHVDIKFHKDNALVVGPNGWGKTNIVRSVAAAIESSQLPFISDLCEKTSKPKKFVQLWFTLTKNETWKILMSRFIFVIEKITKLCGTLAKEKHPDEEYYHNVAHDGLPEARDFWDNVFPKLLGILAKTYDNLDEFIASKVDADVVLHTFKPHIDFTKMQLPESTKEEFKVITSAFTKIFGEDILDKPKAFTGTPNNEMGREEEVTEEEEENQKQEPLEEVYVEREDGGEYRDDKNTADVLRSILKCASQKNSATVRKHVENILNLKIFLGVAGFVLSSENTSIYRYGIGTCYSWFSNSFNGFDEDREISKNHTHSKTMDMILKQLKSIDESSMENTLGEVIETFLKKRSVCILGQNRGNVKQENGALFWNMEKAKKQFISASHSTGDETMLKKFEHALKDLANVELKPIEESPDSHKFAVLFQNDRDKNWRKFDEASGGERELILVLSAIHLSGADTVFLDEPGNSLHPPKQAQLRRWLEQRNDDNQVLFVITHSSDMVSSVWVDGLYHMYSDDKSFSSESLREVVSDESGGSEPPREKRKIPAKINEPGRDSNLVEFFMDVEMRRLLFSSGTVFVEGNTDKRVIEMLRVVELDRQRNPDMERRSRNSQAGHWDIISMEGCANWLKVYQAAANLKVPFLIVLDADVLNNISGSSITPITYERWNNSRLRKAVKNSRCLDDGVHPLAKMVKSIDQITQCKTKDAEVLVREELKNCGLWVWNNSDIESVLFEDDALRNALVKKDSFKKAVERIGISIPEESSKSDTLIDPKDTINKCRNTLKNLYEQADKGLEQLLKNPGDLAGVNRLQSLFSSNVGELKQGLKNVQSSCEKLEITEAGNESKTNFSDFFFKLKKKLHAGCWKSILFEELQDWMSEALEVRNDHPFHLLWEYIRARCEPGRK